MRRKLISCPSCKFPNMPGARTCLTCKAEIPADAPVVTGSDVGRNDLVETQTFPRPNASPDETRMYVTRKSSESSDSEEEPEEEVAAPRVSSTSEEDRVWRSWEESVVAWLYCKPLPPIPLGPKRVVTLGRGSECDLVLPHPTVSRVHAQVRVLGRQLVLEDCSRFGTFLNGRPVSSSQVERGDSLRVGPYEIDVLSPEDGAMQSEPTGEETQPLDLSFGGSDEAELMGSLDRVSLAEILQQFEFNAKSGTLRVSGGGELGMLVVRDGQPRFARLGRLADEEAVLAMLALQAGSFMFSSTEQEGEKTMKVRLTHLLLEHSRRQDEETAGH